jgi:hypothetical protein
MLHFYMQKELILQGRRVSADDIDAIKQLIEKNPTWHRTRLSQEICLQWNWRRANGGLKDIACRSLLRKLEELAKIRLPKAQRKNPNQYRNRYIQPVLHSKEPIEGQLKGLSPVEIRVVERGYGLKLFKYLISKYHYLGWSGTVGENLKYLVFDNCQRVLGCMMFGAAAWKVLPRDQFIGWSHEIRKRNLAYIANNNRFLILPWVKVPHLASHILGRISRRLNSDWQQKYNHAIYLVETFVEKERFVGTCYKASNWIYLGETQGRGKLDVKMEYRLPIKDIHVYPLHRRFRQRLCMMYEEDLR